MSITSVPRSRPTPSWLAPPGSARALRLEFKRNAAPYVLPLLAAVFYFNAVRTADRFPPVWTLRASTIPDQMLFEFTAFAGGLAAWAGSRDGRRKTVDLVAATPRPAWARQGTALAGSLGWLLLAYLAGAVARGDGRLPRAVAVVLVASGVAASSTAFALAGTAKPDAVGGWEIPALHSAADDQPVPAAQDCTSSSAFEVCVHPAFGFYLDDLAAALDPVAAEIAGLPGAPAGAREVASVSGGQDVQSGIAANPAVFEFTAEHVGTMFGQFLGNGGDPVGWREGFQQGLLDAFLTGSRPNVGPGPAPLGLAQQAVEDALMAAVRSQPPNPSATSAGISAAAQRFAALSASARHAWLAANLAALRAGTITLAQIP
jgi:hypothetical protein